MTVHPNGPLCTLALERIPLSSAVGWVIRDGFPVSPGHTLVIAKQHVGPLNGRTGQLPGLMLQWVDQLYT